MDASYIVAGLLVCFFAWSRFNTPHSVRSQTSRLQYFGSGTAYVLSCLGVLLGLSWTLRQQPDILSVIHSGAASAIPSELKGLDAALVSALILTTLLPSFPVVRDFDQRMLAFFHKMGAIPFNAMVWAQRMDTAPFAISDGMLAATRLFIRNSESLPDSLTDELQTDPNEDEVRFLLTRNMVLYVSIKQSRYYARFSHEFPEDLAQFEKRVCDFLAHGVGFFTLSRQLPQRSLAAMADSRDNFRRMANTVFDEIELMLSRMLLFSCRGEAEVAQKLNTLGFTVEIPAPVYMPLNLLTFDAVGVVALFALSTFFIPNHMPVMTAISIGLMVAVNHVIAGAFALLPKQVWNFADIRCTRERPALAYVISALSTFTVTLSVSYGFFLLRANVLAPGMPILPFAAQCKWLLLPTVLAFALAFLCDDHARAEHEPRWLRWAEGLSLGALLALAGLLTTQWLLPDQAALHPNSKVPSLAEPVVMSAAIGVLFGMTIPTWYRATIRRAGGGVQWPAAAPRPATA
jgi:hypothetical protein